MSTKNQTELNDSLAHSNNILLFYIDLSRLRGGRFKILVQIVRQFSKALREYINEQVQKICPQCQSSHIDRNGNENRKYGPAVQCYICVNCGKKMCERTFSPFYRRHYPESVIIAAIVLYYEMKLSSREIRRTIKLPIEDGWKRPTEDTIYDWILTFICFIIVGAALFDFPNIDVGVHQPDEMYTSIRGQRAYIAGVAAPNSKLKFIEFLKSVDKDELDYFLRASRCRWFVTPEEYWTDGWNAYYQGVKKSGAKHGIVMHNKEWKSAAGVHTNDIERFWETFRAWWDSARGYKRDDRAWVLVIGFETYFNFLRPHISLDEKPPAAACGVKGDFTWLSLLMLGFLSAGSELKDVIQSLRMRVPKNELFHEKAGLTELERERQQQLKGKILANFQSDKSFVIQYRDRRKRITKRRIKVVNIYEFKGRTYIRAKCFLRWRYRTFRLDRIMDIPD